jgi:hypothetical protein
MMYGLELAFVLVDAALLPVSITNSGASSSCDAYGFRFWVALLQHCSRSAEATAHTYMSLPPNVCMRPGRPIAEWQPVHVLYVLPVFCVCFRLHTLCKDACGFTEATRLCSWFMLAAQLLLDCSCCSRGMRK